MSAKQYRILFFTLSLTLLIGVVAFGNPTDYMQLVRGQVNTPPYIPPTAVRPTRTPAATPTPSSTPTPTATISPFDPFIGSSAPASFQLPQETTLEITEDALLHWEPNEDTSMGLFVLEGQEFPVSGVDETGEWIRISFAGESGWVRRDQTSLPPIRVDASPATPTPIEVEQEEVPEFDS